MKGVFLDNQTIVKVKYRWFTFITYFTLAFYCRANPLPWHNKTLISCDANRFFLWSYKFYRPFRELWYILTVLVLGCPISGRCHTFFRIAPYLFVIIIAFTNNTNWPILDISVISSVGYSHILDTVFCYQ